MRIKNVECFTECFLYLSDSNNKQQSGNKTFIIMFNLIKAFEVKLYIFKCDDIYDFFKYFSNANQITDLEN